jgi:transposase
MFDPSFDRELPADRTQHGERAPRRARPRRNWTTEAKGRLVAAMLSPGANVSEIARAHEISRQHLYLWRRAALAGDLPLPAVAVGRNLAPAHAAKTPRRVKADAAGAALEIHVSGLLVRVYPDADLQILACVLQALKAAL